MRGLCKIGCGFELEYEPHEFSDGFVYYLPRNLDETVHQCEIFNAIMGLYDYGEILFEEYYQAKKNRLNITLNEFEGLVTEYFNYSSIFFTEDFANMGMLRNGQMYELKKHLEHQLDTLAIPFLQEEGGLKVSQDDPIDISVLDSKIDPDDLCNLIQEHLPTGKRYQLECLGRMYELMVRLEDAKKCYDLQYECTGEPELLKISKELDEKISKINIEKRKQETTKSIAVSKSQTKEIIDETELKLREFIIKLFDNNFKEVWKRKPDLFKTIQDIREIKENSLLQEEEENPIQHLSIGHLNTILKISNNEKNAKFEESCKICKKSWIKHDTIFHETINIENKKSQKIICKDKDCFVSQGGLWKEFPNKIIRDVALINETRNALAHPEKYDEEMLHYYCKRAINTCDIINRYVNKYLENKEFV